MDEAMNLKQIGVIRTPFTEAKGTPIQPTMARGVRGTVEVDAEYAEALEDLEGFDRIWLLYWFDRVPGVRLRVKPYMDTVEHGLFATRAPVRPNPVGMSSVRLVERHGGILTVEDVDMLDGTPLLDIKPYVTRFDVHDVERCGWIDAVGKHNGTADNRFHGDTKEDRE